MTCRMNRMHKQNHMNMEKRRESEREQQQNPKWMNEIGDRTDKKACIGNTSNDELNGNGWDERAYTLYNIIYLYVVTKDMLASIQTHTHSTSTRLQCQRRAYKMWWLFLCYRHRRRHRQYLYFIHYLRCVYAVHSGAIDNDLSSLWLTEKTDRFISNSMQIGNCICMKLSMAVWCVFVFAQETSRQRDDDGDSSSRGSNSSECSHLACSVYTFQ